MDIANKTTVPKRGFVHFKTNSLEPCVYKNNNADLYSYRVYTGQHKNRLDLPGGSLWGFSHKGENVICLSSTAKNINDLSSKLVIEILGYNAPERTASYRQAAHLPYVSGCSTAELLPPVRPGDPTWQMLSMPANTSEQKHHIHSTARVVYILSGRCVAVIGQPDRSENLALVPGDVLILAPHCPHHFATGDSDLVALPLHIFSTVTRSEFNHPMRTGTHEA